MPKIRLTEQKISMIPALQDRADYWDTEITGLCLRVRPSGKKSWALRWRNNGKWEFQALGTHPLISVAVARKSAHTVLAQAVLGILPAASQPPSRANVGEVWDSYVTRANGVERLNRASAGKLYILPAFSHYSIEELKTSQIDALVRSLSNKPRTGTAVKRHIHGMFELAKTLNLFPEEKVNPAARVKAYPYIPRNRFLNDVELKKIGDVLQYFMKNRNFNLLYAELITILLLTGARIGELKSAKYDMLDMENPAIILKKHKTDKKGIKRLELGKYGYNIITNLPRKSDYIFYGRAAQGGISNAKRAWYKIRDTAEIAHATIHDLRRTFASVALNNGLFPHEIGILLGHKEISATGIYALADVQKRQELISRAETAIVSRLFP
jgi:integrase